MSAESLEKVGENNKEQTLKLLDEYGFSIYPMIHEELKKDKDIVLKVIHKNQIDFFLNAIPKEVFEDKQFREQCIKANFYLIKLFPELHNIKSYALEAVSHMCIPTLYKTISKEMQQDKDVIIQAVKTDARTLHYVDEELKNDRDVLIAAFKGRSKRPGLISYAPQWIKEKAEKFAELNNDIELFLKEEDVLEIYEKLNADIIDTPTKHANIRKVKI